MVYHGRLVSPSGQVYHCEHNHRTETAAVTCANTSATRMMAETAWRRAALQAAQAAALAKKREEERAAAQARKAAAEQAAAARRAAAHAAAEEAKAAKRAAKLARMSPRRAWKRMTPEERLLKTAEGELRVYGEVITPEARAAYETRSARSADRKTPASAEPAPPNRPALDQAAGPSSPDAKVDVPAFLRAIDPNVTDGERTIAKGEAASNGQWNKYLAARRTQEQARAEAELSRLKQGMTQTKGVPATDVSSTTGAIRPREAALPEPQREARDAGRKTLGTRGVAPALPAAAVTPLGGSTTGTGPTIRSPSSFGGDGLFVVGLDIAPGVYRTAGPATERQGYFALSTATEK